jgi:RNA polymerase sigma-54 factor
MSLTMSQVAQVAPAPLHQPSQWLVTATRLLNASSVDLLPLLQQEAARNPALELEVHPICPTCGRVLAGGQCIECPARTSVADRFQEANHSFEAWEGRSGQSVSGSSDEIFSDLAHYVPSSLSLAEYLRQALCAELPAEAVPIIEYLVGSLDEDGYLHSSVEEAAYLLGVAPAQVEQVLTHLQGHEPAGIGARDVRECLLLQLQALAEAGHPQPAAVSIVERFLTQLGQHKYNVIARQLGLTQRQVEQTHIWIQHHLTPFPARSYLEAHLLQRPESLRPLTPDVIIRRLPPGEALPYEVVVVEAQRYSLSLSDAYVQAYRHLSEQRLGTSTERGQIHQALTEARCFLNSLKRRWDTLARITWALIEQQQAYLEQGIRALQPLTRADLAATLGVHPSTVARATADKYVLLPSAEVVPFATFFTANLPVKEVLREVIAQTSGSLSDRRLAELLEQRGISLARRTVTKYRAELEIGSAFRRTKISAPRRRVEYPTRPYRRLQAVQSR